MPIKRSGPYIKQKELLLTSSHLVNVCYCLCFQNETILAEITPEHTQPCTGAQGTPRGQSCHSSALLHQVKGGVACALGWIKAKAAHILRSHLLCSLLSNGW